MPTARPVEVDARNVGNLPADPAAIASIDPDKLSLLMASMTKGLRPDWADGAERALGLPQRSLSSGKLASSIGINPSLPIVMAVAKLDAHGREILETGRQKADALQGGSGRQDGVARAMEKLLNAHRGPPTHIRIVLPASDQGALLSYLHGLLELRRYGKVQAPAELESLYSRRERVVALSLGPARVIVDIFVFVGAVPRPKYMVDAATSTLRALMDAKGADPLALEGHVARLSYSPSLVAQVGFVERLSRTQDMLGGGSDYALDWNMAKGMRDAGKLFELAGKQHPLFERMDVALDMQSGFPAISSLANVGPGLVAPPPDACAPRPSLDFPGALARFDVTTACMKAVRVPGDPQGDRLDRSSLSGLLQEAGWIGWPVALPFYVMASTRIPLHWWAGVGPRAMMRFERFGWANPAYGAPDAFWGLLPANAKPDELACAIAEDAKDCKGKKRLKPAGLSEIPGGFARVLKIGPRTVVITSRDRSAVEALAPVLTPGPVPALRGAISSGTMRAALQEAGIQTDPIRYVGDAALDAKQWSVTIRPVPGP